MKTLLLFILFCIRVSFDILRIAIAFLRLAIIAALLPRMPLSNWRKEEEHTQVSSSVVNAGQDIRLWKRASTSGPGHIYSEFTNGDEEAAHFKSPKAFTEHIAPVYKLEVDVTPTKSAVVNLEFSIYNDAAPKAATHLLLTPRRPPPIRDVGFTLLKNASERVSEILRENRRRLDAGEDPSTIRREARRKRAMELSAVRRGRVNLFSLS